MNIIGVDLGTSATKIVECDNNGNLVNKMVLEEKSFYKAIDDFINTYNINISTIDKIVLTGVGSSKINEKSIKDIDIIKVDEFISTATGGLELSKKESAIIANIGTGTSFVHASKNDIKHLGGTGLGGGTLIGLCNRLIDTNSFDEINNLSCKGDLSHVDLTIQDITTDEIKTLPKDITASNFAKLSKNTNNSDIALGIINLIFESIGMMAVFVSRNDKIKDIVVVGGLTKIQHIRIVFKKIEKICDAKFLIPENAEYATVIGAVVNYININKNTK